MLTFLVFLVIILWFGLARTAAVLFSVIAGLTIAGVLFAVTAWIVLSFLLGGVPS